MKGKTSKKSNDVSIEIKGLPETSVEIVSVNDELNDDELSYLNSGSPEQIKALEEMEAEALNEPDKLSIQYGDSPWLLITAVRNMSESSRTLVHAMQVGVGVLIRNTDYRGAGMVSSSMVYIPFGNLVKDEIDVDLYKII